MAVTGIARWVDLVRPDRQLAVKTRINSVPTKDRADVRITVLASMRNEGPFIVEWVCWYRMLGFTRVVVVTNNCTDRSPDLLDALQQAGLVEHIRHDIEPGQRVTRAKLRAAFEQSRAVRRADWLMVCDVDEFLTIHRGEGKIGDLIDLGPNPPYLGMSINWRVFGTSDRKTFEDTPVHRQFVYADKSAKSNARFVKSIYRLPKYFGALGEHTPRNFNFARLGMTPDDPGMAWVNSEGKIVPDWQQADAFKTGLPRDLISHEVAQINHYQLRSEETFSLKKGTLSPVAKTDRYRDVYFEKANKGADLDASAFRYAAEFDATWDAVMAKPDVARLHALCCADHVRAIVEKAGGRVEDDPRYHAFLTEADRLDAGSGPA